MLDKPLGIQQSPKIISIRVQHHLIGNKAFCFGVKDTFAEIRSLLNETTAMSIFENYRLMYKGEFINEYKQIGSLCQQNSIITIYMLPFNQKSSLYHFQRVQQILNNPQDWVLLTPNKTDAIDKQMFIPPEPIKQQSSFEVQTFLDKGYTSQLQHPVNQCIKSDKQLFLKSLYIAKPHYQNSHKVSEDFFQIAFTTLEGDQHKISAHPKGFYILQGNHILQQSKQIKFINLIDIFCLLSQLFCKKYKALVQNKMNQFDKLLTGARKTKSRLNWLKQRENKQTNSVNLWCKNTFLHTKQKYQNESFLKQWNQMIQRNFTTESDSLVEKINKQKSKAKVYQQMVEFAKQGAIKVINGQILSKKESPNKQIYQYGNIVFQYGKHDPYYYKIDPGMPTIQDVNCYLKNLCNLQKKNLHHLFFNHVMCVKYKGFCLIATMMIPQEHNLQENQTTHDEKVKQLCDELKIQKSIMYKSLDGKDRRALIHPNLKFIKGSDKRIYLQNLQFLSVKDYNFLGIQNNGTMNRFQLISHFQEKQKCKVHLNVMHGKGFKININQRNKRSELKLKSMAVFAKQIMCPLCIKSLSGQNKKYLADSKSVVKIMHSFGLSSRYLGLMLKRCDANQYPHLHRVLKRVTLVKSLKNVFRMAMQENGVFELKSLIVRLLNIILFSRQQNLESNHKQNRKQVQVSIHKKKKKYYEQYDQETNQFSIGFKICKYNVMNSQQIWQLTKRIANFRYSIQFKEDSFEDMDFLDSHYGKMALLKDLCQCLGFVLERKDYFRQNSCQNKIEINDLVQVNPIVKHIQIQSKQGNKMLQQAKQLENNSKVQEAIQLYLKFIQLHANSSGILWAQLSQAHKRISQIYFKVGQIETALFYGYQCCKICEKYYGVSHIYTIESYTLLSLCYFGIGKSYCAEYYMLKSIHISLTSYGQEYPNIITNYMNLSTIYEQRQAYFSAIVSIGKAMEIVRKIYSSDHQNMAICYAAMAYVHFQIPDIQAAIKFQTCAFQTFRKILNDADPRLRQVLQLLIYYKSIQQSKKVKEKPTKNQHHVQLLPNLSMFNVPGNFQKQHEKLMKKFTGMSKYSIQKQVY